MVNPTITVIIVCKNEEENIKDCLESVTWADEIIIVDQYSTDKTVEIAKRYTQNIFYNDSSNYPIMANRNYGIQKTTKDWIFIFDADERVTPQLKNEILAKIKQDTCDAFYSNFKQVFFNKEFVGPLWTKTKIIRLFKKGHGRYDNMSPHAVISGYTHPGRLEEPILHFGYPDVETFVRKMNFYTTQHALLLAENKPGGLLKKKISKITVYNLFLEPFLFLPYYYLIKQNYKEGIHGILISLLIMYYLYIERFKYLEIKNKERMRI